MSRLRCGRRGALLVSAAATLGLLATACGADGPAEPADAAAQTILVTTSIWGDVVANVACGGEARVELIVPAGADAHGFESSLADRARLEDAALVVANGLGLEGGLDDTLAAVERTGVPVLRLAEHVETDAGDPHVWFDPRRVSAALDVLAQRLVADAGLDQAEVDACVEAYRAELEALDGEIAELVVAVPAAARTLVTNHEVLGYFADRYGFEIVGTVIPAASTLAQASPARLEELAELIEETGVPAIFAESQHGTDDADALASRVGGVTVVALFTETLGEPGSGADTYVGFMRTNARLIVDALTARP